MTKVVIGPLNAAGQAAAWAAALRRDGLVATSVSFRPRPRPPWARRPSFDAPPDARLPYPRMTTARGRRRRANRLLDGVSHLVLDGFVPLLGNVAEGLTGSELAELSTRGIRVALLAHGSDVRDPERHARETPGSFFPLLDPTVTARLTTRSARNRQVARGSDLPLFVSTPDLLLDLPEATWLPLCVDNLTWKPVRRTPSARPRFLHAPSSGGMKGSDVIDPALRALHEEGRIEYVRPHGVPHSEMPGLVASVDVVVDQVRSGSYGTTAVEAMLSHKVVVAHVSDAVRGLLPEDPGIVEAPPSSFRDAIDELLDSREQWSAHADRSHAFAVAWHDGTASARALRTVVTD